MDHSTQSIAEFATRLTFEDLPPEVVHDCKRRIIDTIGCAIAAFDAEPARIARAVATRASVANGAAVIGTAHRTLPELAAFANAVASRYIEGNDTYPGGGGHPSDCLLPILAVAQASGANMKAAITGIVLGYEAHRYLFRAFPMRKHALDYVLYNAVSSAVGASKVLGLSLEQTAHAIALAAVPNLGTDISRRGHLTMWKGCAAANAARNGVTAAIMAQAGMAGPPTPFEDGLTAVIGAEEICPFPIDPLGFSLPKADYKFFLSEFHAQGPAFLALELRPQIKLDDIEKIEVFTYHFAWFEIGSGEEKWKPATRETADHSMPYVVGAVLIDGAYTDAIFEPARFNDPRTLELMKKITITEDADFNRRYPGSLPCRMCITLKNGETRTAELSNPIGHHDRPMSDAQLIDKFKGLAGRRLAPAQLQKVLDRAWKIENDAQWTVLFDEVRVGAN
ncbi:MmgE/PrpD family protein [Rhodoplanes sp. Z2-YC6860]|uniref:MmgE/PrpD family protein n=1 Tax=Rhodoplanes sp. Z2-YC6860 TaxID=674703 RepID=UPI00078D6F92|nr:MmgE/PrpD family protein [Rhodoplanes sp. Z2-YC6860]AMN39521.1 2-methylcitrate dehydratase [Rhodoplanes sp. Z2-YC6860]